MGDTQDEDGDKYYISQIHGMKDNELTTLYVDFSHLLEREEVLARAVAEQYYRFLPYLRLAVQELVKEYERDYLYTNAHTNANNRVWSTDTRVLYCFLQSFPW